MSVFLAEKERFHHVPEGPLEWREVNSLDGCLNWATDSSLSLGTVWTACTVADVRLVVG